MKIGRTSKQIATQDGVLNPARRIIMPDPDRGAVRAGCRNKRFGRPLQKYEIRLQLISQEVTREAADQY